jgi:hypothetical protein
MKTAIKNIHEYFDDKGHLNDGGVSIYVDALKLNREDKLPEALTYHVESCPVCKQSIVLLDDLLREHTYDTLVFHHRLSEKKLLTRNAYLSLRVAAGLILILGLAFVASIVLFDRDVTISDTESMHDAGDLGEEYAEEMPPVVLPSPDNDDPGIDRDEQLYGANFETSTVYESLLNIRYRSHGIQVILPKTGEEIDGTVHFDWDIQYTGTIYLTILNNREDEIHTEELIDNSFLYSAELEPGVYYWKLESEDELLYTGKFIIPVK